MTKPSPLIWLVIVLVFLLPSTVGRLLLDLAGGLMLLFILIPIILTGIGWIGWKILKSKFKKCDSCGASFINKLDNCPICGCNTIKENKQTTDSINIPASSATIDITPKENN